MRALWRKGIRKGGQVGEGVKQRGDLSYSVASVGYSRELWAMHRTPELVHLEAITLAFLFSLEIIISYGLPIGGRQRISYFGVRWLSWLEGKCHKKKAAVSC